MNIIFNVQSNRLDDIKVQPGTTVGALLHLLRAAGYDVKDAVIRIHDPETHHTYIGDVEPYVLKDMNGVQFRTFTLGLDNTAKELFAEFRKQVEEEAPKQEPKQEHKCAKCHGCASPAYPESSTVNTRRLVLSVDENGNVVHVQIEG